MNIMSTTHQCGWPLRIQDHPDKASVNKAPLVSGYHGTYYPSSRGLEFLNVGYLSHKCGHGARKCRPIFSSSVSGSVDPSDSDDIDKNKSKNDHEIGGVC